MDRSAAKPGSEAGRLHEPEGEPYEVSAKPLTGGARPPDVSPALVSRHFTMQDTIGADNGGRVGENVSPALVSRHSISHTADEDENTGLDLSKYSDPESAVWLLGILQKLDIERPKVRETRQGWELRDGRVKLCHTLRVDEVLKRDPELIRDEVLRLRHVIALRLCTKKRDDLPLADMFGSVAQCIHFVRQEIVWDLIRERNDKVDSDGKAIPIDTWAYNRAAKACKDWKAAKQKQKKPKDDRERQKRLLDDVFTWATSLIGTNAREFTGKFNAWRNSGLEKTAPPWPRSTTFSIKSNSVKLAIEKIDNRDQLFVTLSMFGVEDGHRLKQPQIRLYPGDAHNWSVVHKMLSGEYRQESAKIVKQDKDWMLKITYSHPKPKPAEGGSMLMLRSMVNFACFCTNDGRSPREGIKANNLIAIKAQLQNRRTAIRQSMKLRGEGSRGHGKKRAYTFYQALSNKEANYVDTWCKLFAVEVAQTCKNFGCSELVIEDFGSQVPEHSDTRYQAILRRFPFAKLKDTILVACAKIGIKTREAKSSSWAKCPLCDSVLAKDRNVMCCPTCDIDSQIDMWRLLRMAKNAELPFDGLLDTMHMQTKVIRKESLTEPEPEPEPEPPKKVRVRGKIVPR